MPSNVDSTAVAAAAKAVVEDFMCVKSGEQVLLTADMGTDPAAIAALATAARLAGARVTLCQFPQLPFQGSLADPYVPEPVAAALLHCDAWFDLTFPYMFGSAAHQKAMEEKRSRCLLIGDLGGEGLARLFGAVDLDALFAVQHALDELITASVGSICRVTCPLGSDFAFTIGKPATTKLRHTDRPGTYTPPGSAVIYPEPETVKGEIVIQGAFHEYHTRLPEPIRLRVDGKIREAVGGANELAFLDRALKRAGNGAYGSIIHLSHGFHPAARFTGRSFVEDIRAKGNNAIGFGIPWWQAGGGENHPDGVLLMQSLSIDGKEIVRDGALVYSDNLARLAEGLVPRYH